jgi:hypothetical protein
MMGGTMMNGGRMMWGMDLPSLIGIIVLLLAIAACAHP